MTIITFRRTLFLLFMFIAFSLSHYSLAQTSVFVPPSTIAEPASNITIPVRIDSFLKIVTIQFTLEWDKDILLLKGVNDFGLNLNLEDNFKLGAEDGNLSFLWFDNSANASGVNLEDSSTLFSLEFEVVGTPGASSEIAFTNSIATKEIADTSFLPIPSEFFDGKFTVKGSGPLSVNGFNNNPGFVELQPVFPNPLANQSVWRCKTNASTDASFRIYDSHGQIVSLRKLHLEKGWNDITVNRSDLKTSGVFFLFLEAPEFIVTEKLIRL